MYYYAITASWKESGSDIMTLVGQLTRDGSNALLFNLATESTTVYLATMDPSKAAALREYFYVSELDSIDYARDFIISSNRQWGVEGNRALVNF